MDWFEIEDAEKFNQEMKIIKSQLLTKIIPAIYPKEVAAFSAYGSNVYISRYEVIGISSFALISRAWLKPLSEYIGSGKCLEIMAGRGILSKGLNDFGIDIICTDNFSWKWHRSDREEKNTLEPNQLWYDVENIDCIDAIEKYGRAIDYLICCWPYMDDGAYNSLVKMREINPHCKLIYIGEGEGGCTADDSFFETAVFVENDDKFKLAANKFQCWWGVHDQLHLVL